MASLFSLIGKCLDTASTAVEAVNVAVSTAATAIEREAKVLEQMHQASVYERSRTLQEQLGSVNLEEELKKLGF